MITSRSNEKVRLIRELRAKKKARDEQGLFVAEGERICREIPVDALAGCFVSASYAEEHTEYCRVWQAEILTDDLFRYACDTVNPQGVLCLVKKKLSSYEEIEARMLAGRPVVLLEHLQDPGNLGTILRTGEAAGIAGVIADAQTADLFNPKTIRSTMGSVFRVPYLVSGDLPGVIGRLRKAGAQVFAASPAAGKTYEDCSFLGYTAFLIGNEGNGLSAEISALATQTLSIPMEGEVESLNASMAAALLMFEAARQRRHVTNPNILI